MRVVFSSGTKAGSSPQPLVQWMEVTNHPGLVCCMTQTSNNPVILMVKPDAILVQEIRVLPPKAKVRAMLIIGSIFATGHRFGRTY